MRPDHKPKRKKRGPLETSGPPPVSKKGPKSRPLKLRIIGGRLRGRTVKYHGATFTRPMKDSVRENLFNILGDRVRGSRVIDLFAGTGAVTFEAVSRGAAEAVMVERNRDAHRVLIQTAEGLGIADRVRVLLGDAFRIGGRLLEAGVGDDAIDDTPRILFLCPPYAMWRSDAEALGQLVRLALVNSPPGSLVVAETDKHDDASVLPAADWDHRLYGGTRLSVAESELICGLRG
jgi:16S rRNA (guanine966-N2)-methyltransferase